MLNVHADWLVKLRISCAIYLRATREEWRPGLHPWKVKKSSKVIFCSVCYLTVLVYPKTTIRPSVGSYRWIFTSLLCGSVNIREFTKPRQQRQLERRWTKELMNRTMVLHVRYNCWYISVSSSSKWQLEMTKFCVVWRTWTTTANFWNFYIKFIAVFRIYFCDHFDSDKQS